MHNFINSEFNTNLKFFFIMNKKLICLLAFVFSLCLGFTACSSDDDPADLKLDKTTVSVEVGKTVEVKITEGNGNYTVTSATAATAEAKVENKVITITGVVVGETNVVVKDGENKTATVKVTVTAKDLAPDVVGTYAGELAIAELDLDGIESDIELTRMDVNKVKIALNDFMLPNIATPASPIEVGDIVVENVPVTLVDGVYQLTETTATITVTPGGIETEVDVKISGTITDGILELAIEVDGIPGFDDGLTVTFESTPEDEVDPAPAPAE